MKRFFSIASGLLAVVAIAVAGSTAAQGQVASWKSTPTKFTEAEFDDLFRKNNNWGRWGKDDTLGTLNLITDAKRRQAASLVKNGVSVTVAHELSGEQAADNPRPMTLTMAPNFRADTISVFYHGGFFTHIDALCHYPYKDRLYNDRPLTVNSEKGCFPGVEHMKNGIVTRGILLDIPGFRGVEYLEPGTAIFKDEVEAWEKKHGIRIGAGDVVLIHTGRWARRAKLGPQAVLGNSSGFDTTMGPWIKQRDIAIIGGDVSAEVQTTPPIVAGLSTTLHPFLIAGLGMPILDNVDTEALAAAARRLNRYEFMFVVAPLAIPGGTGSPVNPIAVF